LFQNGGLGISAKVVHFGLTCRLLLLPGLVKMPHFIWAIENWMSDWCGKKTRHAPAQHLTMILETNLGH